MKLTIDRATWLHGETGRDSKLLRGLDGKKCCMGFLALAIGISEDSIAGQPDFEYIEYKPEFDWLWQKDAAVRGFEDACDLAKAMITNDAPLGKDYEGTYVDSEEEREARLTEIFARHDIEVEFIG